MHKVPTKNQEAWSLDDVCYSTNAKDQAKNVDNHNIEGCFINKLYLEGCRYTNQGLDDPDPDNMLPELPVLYVTAVKKSSQ